MSTRCLLPCSRRACLQLNLRLYLTQVKTDHSVSISDVQLVRWFWDEYRRHPVPAVAMLIVLLAALAAGAFTYVARSGNTPAPPAKASPGPGKYPGPLHTASRATHRPAASVAPVIATPAPSAAYSPLPAPRAPGPSPEKTTPSPSLTPNPPASSGPPTASPTASPPPSLVTTPASPPPSSPETFTGSGGT